MGRLVAIVACITLATACTRDSPPPTSTGSEDVRHVVLDTDLAFDDIMALFYLLQRDDVVIDAVTIAGTGEAHCDPGIRNALGLLALGGSPDTPVACGRETPLQGSNAFPDEWRAAVDDLSMLDLPETDAVADPRGAVGLLLETLDGRADLITLGPLTNVAAALRADPDVAERVGTFVAMAGAIDVPGNTPNGVAEYNVWVDPLAAKEVVEGMDVTLVPLDATDDVPFTTFFVEALEAHLSTPEAEAVHRIILANEPIFTQSGYSFWDTLATALVFRPDLATFDEARVNVTASLDAGADWIDRYVDGSLVRFASSVPDPLVFEREYLSVLTGETVAEIRPDPTVTITFDGARCSLRPTSLSAGNQVVAYDGPTEQAQAAVLLHLDERITYEELRGIVGPDGSLLPPVEEPPKGVETIAFVQQLAEATAVPSTLVAACVRPVGDDGSVRLWLSEPVAVAS